MRMSVGKKLAAAMLMVAAGVSVANFFRKDAPPSPSPQETADRFTFRDRVQRRVWADRQWAENLDPSGQPVQPLRVPNALPAAIGDAFLGERQPTFERSHNPVGALLGQIETADISSDEPRDSFGDDQLVIDDRT